MMYVLVLVFAQLIMIFLYFMLSKLSNISRQKIKFFRVLHMVVEPFDHGGSKKMKQQMLEFLAARPLASI